MRKLTFAELRFLMMYELLHIQCACLYENRPLSATTDTEEAF